MGKSTETESSSGGCQGLEVKCVWREWLGSDCDGTHGFLASFPFLSISPGLSLGNVDNVLKLDCVHRYTTL